MLESLAGLAELELRVGSTLAAGWLTLIINHPAAIQETKKRAERLLTKFKAQSSELDVETGDLNLERIVGELLTHLTQ